MIGISPVIIVISPWTGLGFDIQIFHPMIFSVSWDDDPHDPHEMCPLSHPQVKSVFSMWVDGFHQQKTNIPRNGDDHDNHDQLIL